MKDASALELLNDLLEPLSRCLDAESARRVAEFPVGPIVEEKIRVLAEKANEGLLNDDERADYEAVVNTADIHTGSIVVTLALTGAKERRLADVNVRDAGQKWRARPLRSVTRTRSGASGR